MRNRGHRCRCRRNCRLQRQLHRHRRLQLRRCRKCILHLCNHLVRRHRQRRRWGCGHDPVRLHAARWLRCCSGRYLPDRRQQNRARSLRMRNRGHRCRCRRNCRLQRQLHRHRRLQLRRCRKWILHLRHNLVRRHRWRRRGGCGHDPVRLHAARWLRCRSRRYLPYRRQQNRARSLRLRERRYRCRCRRNCRLQ